MNLNNCYCNHSTTDDEDYKYYFGDSYGKSKHHFHSSSIFNRQKIILFINNCEEKNKDLSFIKFDEKVFLEAIPSDILVLKLKKKYIFLKTEINHFANLLKINNSKYNTDLIIIVICNLEKPFSDYFIFTSFLDAFKSNNTSQISKLNKNIMHNKDKIDNKGSGKLFFLSYVIYTPQLLKNPSSFHTIMYNIKLKKKNKYQEKKNIKKYEEFQLNDDDKKKQLIINNLNSKSYIRIAYAKCLLPLSKIHEAKLKLANTLNVFQSSRILFFDEMITDDCVEICNLNRMSDPITG